MCSRGDVFEERAGHGNMLVLLDLKKVRYDFGCMKSDVVMLIKNVTWLPLWKWYCSWTSNVFHVTDS